MSTPATASAFFVSSPPATATAFLVSALPVASAFIVSDVETAPLPYTINPLTCATVRVTYTEPAETLGGDPLALGVVDAITNLPVEVAGGEVEAGSFIWDVSTTGNQVLLVSLNGEPDPMVQPILVNCKALKVQNRLARKAACACRQSDLRLLLDYNALAEVLFSTGDYVTCQEYLNLILDMAPCGCTCA